MGKRVFERLTVPLSNVFSGSRDSPYPNPCQVKDVIEFYENPRLFNNRTGAFYKGTGEWQKCSDIIQKELIPEYGMCSFLGDRDFAAPN